MNIKKIHFIGGGRVTKIILTAFSNGEKEFDHVMVTDVNKEVLKKLAFDFPFITTSTDITQSVEDADMVFLALHPPACVEALQTVKGIINDSAFLVSLAPKITSAKLSEVLGGFDRIIRMIPNAPTVIGSGYNPVYFSNGINEDEKVALFSFFQILGKLPETEERKLEAYAILTGMGPTYFWFQFYKLVELSEGFGLDYDEANEGLAEMLMGSILTMFSQMTKEEILDLIPVKPIGEHEADISQAYEEKLTALFNKIKS